MHRPGWLHSPVLFICPLSGKLYVASVDICWATSSSPGTFRDAYWCARCQEPGRWLSVAPFSKRFARDQSPGYGFVRIWLRWSVAEPLFTAARPAFLYQVASWQPSLSFHFVEDTTEKTVQSVSSFYWQITRKRLAFARGSRRCVFALCRSTGLWPVLRPQNEVMNINSKV